jgi:hypothetical protein
MVSRVATGPAGVTDVEELDRVVEEAIRAGESGPLRVLGYGELTLVLGWPPEQPALAVKRLPVFRERARLERYDAVLRRYIDALERRGVGVVPTQLQWAGEEPALHAYLVQPLVARERQLDRVLAAAAPDRGEPLLDGLAARVVAAVDSRTGLDAQVANWAVEGDELRSFDVSTPLLRDEAGRDALDVELFLSVYPWALRPALGRIAHAVMAQYHDPRTVLLDVASNLVKERLERWLPALLRAANDRVAPAIEEREVRRYFVRDRRLWLTMQRLRRADRSWQRRVRRRPYPFLLPPPYAYGPPEESP